MIEGSMDEQYRPGSPPAHAIYTIDGAKARGELPPRLVPAPRRFLMLRGPRTESSSDTDEEQNKKKKQKKEPKELEKKQKEQLQSKGEGGRSRD
jgi:hypothetical protein